MNKLVCVPQDNEAYFQPMMIVKAFWERRVQTSSCWYSFLDELVSSQDSSTGKCMVDLTSLPLGRVFLGKLELSVKVVCQQRL